MKQEIRWLDTGIQSSGAGRLHAFLRRYIYGQAEVLRRVSDAWEMWKLRGRMAHHPLGSFLCIGPTGTGKTLLPEATASFLFGSSGDRVELFGSEYAELVHREEIINDVAMSNDEVAACPKLAQERIYCYGYSAKQRSKQWETQRADCDALGERIKCLQRKLKSVQRNNTRSRKEKFKLKIQLRILESTYEKLSARLAMDCTIGPRANYPAVLHIQGIEHAHPWFIERVLLPILENGYLKMESGNFVDFRGCFVFIETGVGVEEFAEIMKGSGAIGFHQSSRAEGVAALHRRIEETLLAKLLARVEILQFNALDEEASYKVAKEELRLFKQRLGFPKLKIDQNVLQWIVGVAQVENRFGARAITRAIVKYIEIPFARLSNREKKNGGVGKNERVVIRVDGNALRFGVREKS